jgi:hypothetical protein
VQGSSVRGAGYRVQSAEGRVQGSNVQGAGFRVAVRRVQDEG